MYAGGILASEESDAKTGELSSSVQVAGSGKYVLWDHVTRPFAQTNYVLTLFPGQVVPVSEGLSVTGSRCEMIVWCAPGLSDTNNSCKVIGPAGT